MLYQDPGIAVTGIGMVTSIGTGKSLFWESALAGQNGVSRVTLFDTSDYKIHVAAEVHNPGFQTYLNPGEIAALGKQAQMALFAAREAVADANLDLESEDPARISCCMGLLVGEPVLHQTVLERWNKDLPDGDSSPEPYGYPWQSPSAVISKALGLEGPSQSIFCACASGNYAIARACDLLRRGKARIVLAGSADVFNQATFTSFYKWRSMASDCCRLFCLNRQGIIVGEGAAVLVLETLDAAIRAGRKIYAQVRGYGISCDAYHLTAPHPNGRGAVQAMRLALHDAHLHEDEIDYISAHGTGTEANDRIETQAVKEVFGAHSPNLLISSLKSMIGHPMGAASAIEAAACCLSVNSGQIPPTINLDSPDPACDLNYVPNQAISKTVRYAMNNSFGFGGLNCVVIFGQPNENRV